MNKQTLFVVISSVISLILIFTLIQANRQQTFRIYTALETQGHESFSATGLSVFNLTRTTEDTEDDEDDEGFTHPLSIEQFEMLLENATTYYVSADILYLREGPGYDYASLATLYKNDTVLGANYPADDQFGVIQIGDLYGYLDFNHLSETALAEEENQGSEETEETENTTNSSSSNNTTPSSGSSGSSSSNNPEQVQKEPKITTEIVTETKEINFKTETIKDNTLEEDARIVTQKGEKGQLTTKIEITYTDGKKTNEKIIDESKIEPIPEIVRIGPPAKDDEEEVGEINGDSN